MGNKSKNKDYLVQGTILVAASFIARIIGMVYRIPLKNILGTEGIGYYSTANELYNIILMVSSFSIPLAVSRMVSERLHAGEQKNAYRVFKCAMRFAIAVGAAMSIVTFLFAGVITKYAMKAENASYALRVLAPAIFLFAITGVFRGFFQGRSTMVPTAASQVIEQVVNAIVSLAAAFVFVGYGTKLGEKKGNDSLGAAYGAAGGTLGTVISIAVALIFLIAVYMAYRGRMNRQLRRDVTTEQESDREIYKILIWTLVPIVLSTVIYNIGTVLDQGVFNAILAGQGYTEKQYVTIWGVYSGEFRVLMNVPLSIASCLAPSVVPSLAAVMSDNDTKEASIKVRDTIRYTMILTIPCAVGFLALSSPIMRLIFSDSTELASGIMQTGSLLIVLLGLSTLTTGILQGLGRMKEPMIHSAIALVLHLILLAILMTVFKLNIYGVLYSNIFFGLIMCILNAISIKKYLRYRQELVRTFIIPLVSSGIMGLAAYGVYNLCHLAVGNAISCLAAILVAIVVYGVVLIKLRGITERELYAIPKSAILVGVLKKCRLL